MFKSIARPDEEYTNYEEEPQAQILIVHMTGSKSTKHMVRVMRQKPWHENKVHHTTAVKQGKEKLQGSRQIDSRKWH